MLFGRKKKKAKEEEAKRLAAEKKAAEEKAAAEKEANERVAKEKAAAEKVAKEKKATETKKVEKTEPKKENKTQSKPEKTETKPVKQESEEETDVEVEIEEAGKTRKAIYRVIFDKEDRLWKIKKDGAKRVIDSRRTKEEALERVQELSQSQDSKFVVYKKDGKFKKKTNLNLKSTDKGDN